MSTLVGPIDWGLNMDEDGQRGYEIVFLVRVEDPTLDGPRIAMSCTELPVVGSYWSFGNDVDLGAWCKPNWKVERAYVPEEPDVYWKVTVPFSTKAGKRCQDSTIENPMDEPIRMGGGFVHYTKEAYQDRNGVAITNYVGELFKGAAVEFDDDRDTIWFEINSVTLPLALLVSMKNTVNNAPLWGVPARCIRYKVHTWERLVYGTCNYYYRIRIEFEINILSFDKTLLQYGTKCLRDGQTVSDPGYSHRWLQQATDDNGNILEAVPLKSNGTQLDAGDPVEEKVVEYYTEANYLLLGIPATLPND